MLSFLEYNTLDESRYQPREGESEILHHVSTSPKNFNIFRPMSHFGDADAARHFGKYSYTPHHYAVRIKLGRVHELSDSSDSPDFNNGGGSNHNPQMIANILHHEGIMSFEDYDNPKHTQSHAAIARYIRSRGIDTLKYKNNEEGGTSYIITHPNQVRVLKQSIPGYTKINPPKRGYIEKKPYDPKWDT
jgi:hypothetical protein